MKCDGKGFKSLESCEAEVESVFGILKSAQLLLSESFLLKAAQLLTKNMSDLDSECLAVIQKDPVPSLLSWLIRPETMSHVTWCH